MKQTAPILFFYLVFGVAAIVAQDNELENNAADFTERFQSALKTQDITSFIEDNIIPNSELQLLVDMQNEDMGVAEGDPGHFTVEQAQTIMRQTRQNFVQSFKYGLHALDVIDRISPSELAIQDYRVQKSYWEPPVVEVAMLATTGEKEFAINISNLSLVNDRPVIGPSSRIEFTGYQPEDVIAYYTIEALKREDAEYYAENVLTDAHGLKDLIEADSETQIPTGINAEEFYVYTRKRIVRDFAKLLETGSAEGINWSDIEKTWSGYSASLQGQLYQASIPFQFKSENDEYRVVLDFCQQLASEKSVFLPGEFRWEGKVE